MCLLWYYLNLRKKKEQKKKLYNEIEKEIE